MFEITGTEIHIDGKTYPLFVAENLISHYPQYADGLKRAYIIKKYDLGDTILTNYQKIGSYFLLTRRKAILADEVGLGKTAQSSYAAKYLIEHKLVDRVLFITPASLIGQWQKEFETKFIHKDLIELNEGTEDSDYLICNYEKSWKDWFLKYTNERTAIIMDEATKIKNFFTKTAERLYRNNSKYMFLLTGTPIQNSPVDIWSLFQQMHLKWLGDYEWFINQYGVLEDKTNQNGVTFRQITGWRRLDDLNKRIYPLLLRRHRKDVLKELPEVQYYDIEVTLSNKEMFVYKKIKDRILNVRGFDYRIALYTILKRYLDYPKVLVNTHAIKGLVDKSELNITSSKFVVLQELIEELFDKKIIIYSQFADVVDYLAKELNTPYIYHEGIDDTIINEFKQDGHILVTTDKGKYGFNLQEANVIINYDLPWNPDGLVQREGRIVRRGQDQETIIYTLQVSAMNFVEDYIRRVLNKKENIAGEILGD